MFYFAIYPCHLVVHWLYNHILFYVYECHSSYYQLQYISGIYRIKITSPRCSLLFCIFWFMYVCMYVCIHAVFHMLYISSLIEIERHQKLAHTCLYFFAIYLRKMRKLQQLQHVGLILLTISHFIIYPFVITCRLNP